MSAIEWTDIAHSCVRGCSRASAGCDNCYSARLDGTRLAHLTAVPGVVMGDLVTLTGKKKYAYNGRVLLDHDALAKALKLPRARDGKSRRVFWNHRSDTFHERLTNEEVAAQFGVMAARPDLTFLVLTKRARRMREWFEWVAQREVTGRSMFPHDTPSWRIGQLLQSILGKLGIRQPYERATARNNYEPFDPRCQSWPLPNVWMGVSVEDQAAADERIPDLLQAPAAKRFVSYEPALGLVDFRAINDGSWHDAEGADMYDALKGSAWWSNGDPGLSNGPSINWIIAGAESGPGSRPAPLEWVRSVRDQVLETRIECKRCIGAGWILADGGVIYPGSNSAGRRMCGECAGRGCHGPALFVKQWDVCKACSGDGLSWPYEMVSAACPECEGEGRTGKVCKGCPAIDGRVWAEVPV